MLNEFTLENCIHFTQVKKKIKDINIINEL